MLFLKTQVEFPAWQFTSVCNFSSRTSDTLTQTCVQARHHAHEMKLNENQVILKNKTKKEAI